MQTITEREYYEYVIRPMEIEKEREQEFINLIKDNAELFEFMWQRRGQACGEQVMEIIKKVIGFSESTSRKRKGKKNISHQLQKKIFERDKYRCLHCGTHINLSVDHVIPESKGGTLSLDNLQTLCMPCNSRKGVSLQ